MNVNVGADVPLRLRLRRRSGCGAQPASKAAGFIKIILNRRRHIQTSKVGSSRDAMSPYHPEGVNIVASARRRRQPHQADTDRCTPPPQVEQYATSRIFDRCSIFSSSAHDIHSKQIKSLNHPGSSTPHLSPQISPRGNRCQPPPRQAKKTAPAPRPVHLPQTSTSSATKLIPSPSLLS